jgi:hypothetical protein
MTNFSDEWHKLADVIIINADHRTYIFQKDKREGSEAAKEIKRWHQQFDMRQTLGGW